MAHYLKSIRCGPGPVLALVLCLVSLAGIDPAFAQQKQKRSTPVEIAHVRQEKIATLAKVDGTIVINAAVNISATKSGKVTVENLKIGEWIKQGDLIARIDVSELDTVLQELLLHEKKKKNQIENSAVRLAAEKRRIDILQKQSELIKGRLDRIATLAQEQVASQSTLAEINIRYFEKQQQIIQAEIILINLRQAREEMRADLETLQNSIIDIKRQINDAVITSPIDGQITSLADFNIGYSRVGDTLAVLQRDEDYEIEADIPIDWMNYLRAQKEITYTDHRGLERKARYRVELPQENPRSRTRVVRLVPVDPLDEDLRTVGASVALMIPTSDADLQMTVPSDALIPMQNGYIVFVIRDGKASRQQIVTGGIINGRVIIVDGLNVEDQVVIKGNELLSNGQVVTVIENSKG